MFVALAFWFAMHPIDLETALSNARRGGGREGDVEYSAPSPLRRAAEVALFRALFDAARATRLHDVRALSATAAHLGFTITLGRDGERGPPIALVTESPNRRRGAGAYVIRVGVTASETFVQAPHSFSDRGTLLPSLALFRSLGARALAVNTVHRRRAPDSDVAHAGNSTFHGVSLAWLASGRPALLLQLHGFVDGRVPADLVLSAGTGSATPRWLSVAKSALAQELPDARVAVFPDELNQLGGVTNAQGRAARRAGARFLHVEIGASLRAHGPRSLVPALQAAVHAATRETE